MINSIQIRTSKATDLKTFHTMSLQKHIGDNLNPKSHEQFQDEYHDNATIFLSVMCDKTIAGYIILRKEKEVTQLKRIVIDQARLGLGQKALTLIESYCKDKLGITHLWLDVYEDNARAIHVYEKLGYRVFKQEKENDRKVLFIMSPFVNTKSKFLFIPLIYATSSNTSLAL